ncbi:MAG: hypothetical protein M1365_06350, partial [Actinobacteria bacterium]|nr:hypothetical protein [Actinomycetota bacterium]
MDTSRELFLKIMGFSPCERTLKWEFGYWGGTINRWYKEGLHKTKGFPTELKYGQAIPGNAVAAGSPSWGGEIPVKDYDVSHYFNFDEGFTLLPYNYWIFPIFEKKVIYEDDKYIDFYDVDGIRKKNLKDDSSMPFFMEWPVKSENDWEKMKEERFNFDSIGKRFSGNYSEFIEESKNIKSPLGIFDAPTGFFGSIRFLIGEENLFLLYYDNPELLNSILDHLCNLWLAMAEELLPKINFDFAAFWEDMAGRQGSFISPAVFRQFMTPRYRRIISFLKSKGMKHFLVDTDGNVNDLIPLFLEAGITIMYPFEQQAGNDLLEMRKKFPNLGMIGGFDVD